MKNIYNYDVIYVDYAVIGEPAVLRVMNYTDGIEKCVTTPSPVVSMYAGSPTQTCIVTEMSVVQTNEMPVMAM